MIMSTKTFKSRWRAIQFVRVTEHHNSYIQVQWTTVIQHGEVSVVGRNYKLDFVDDLKELSIITRSLFMYKKDIYARINNSIAVLIFVGNRKYNNAKLC